MLTQIADDLWYAEHDLFMPGRIHFCCRMTVIRLGEGRLILHSPIAISDELAQEIDKLGQVSWLVAPNNFHHLFLRSCLKHWPEAEIWAAPGLDKKRKKLIITGFLDQPLPDAWHSTLETQFIGGVPKVNEVVFFHKPTKTLIVTDLVFHIQNYKTFHTGWILRLAGVHKKMGQSRMWRLVVKNRHAAGEAAASIFRWDFKRVVMAHGTIIEDNAKAVLQKGLHWMLKGQKIPSVINASNEG